MEVLVALFVVELALSLLSLAGILPLGRVPGIVVLLIVAIHGGLG